MVEAEYKKGIILIGLGMLLLVLNDWVTIRLITLLFALMLINYGLLKMGKPSLFDYARNVLQVLNFWK